MHPDELMERLRRADVAPGDLDLPPLRVPPPQRAPRRTRAALAACVVVAAAGAFVLVGLPSNTPPDVLAGVRKSLAVGRGTLFVESVTRQNRGSRVTSTTRESTWLDQDAKRLRAVTVTTTAADRLTTERVVAEGRERVWSSVQPDVIRSGPAMLRTGSPADDLRQLVSEGQLVVAGRAKRYGESAWRLRSKATSGSRIEAFVDEATFVPIEVVRLDVAGNGQGDNSTLRTRFLTFRRLSAANSALRMSPHPGAKVIARSAGTARAVPFRPPGG